MRPDPSRPIDHREFPVLYVEDDLNLRRIFELTFRGDFEILTAANAEQGLEILNNNPIAVVLSDQRMPGLSGVDFLARVRAIDPKTIRMLVTAYGNKDVLGEAINDSSIFQYISKPWSQEELGPILRRAIEAYALDRERDVQIRELTQLNLFAKNLHRELDLERVIDQVLRTTRGELGFDAAVLLFFDESGDRLEWVGAEPRDEVAVALERIEIGRCNARDFIEDLECGTAQTLRVECLDDLSRVLRDWLIEVSADEIFVVPLRGASSVIGALAVDNRSGGRRFGADDERLLDGIATQAVIAIENARIVAALRSARRDALGTLAVGLAHEISNPLVSAQTFVALAKEKRRAPDDAEFWQTYHQLACTELDRIRSLISTLLRLADRGTEGREVTEVCLVRLLDEVAASLRVELQVAGVHLVCDCEPDTPAVFGVRPQLQQMMRILASNAIAATSDGGQVAMRLSAERDREHETVCLVVEDSGTAIDMENLERIFDPFFTAKDPVRGGDIGWMLAQRIVNDHGGSIEVKCRPGEGSSFCVRLPVKPPINRGPASSA